MRSQSSSVKFTYEDYLLFPEDGRRHELIAGDHYVTPAPNTKHQRVIANLGAILVTEKNIQGAPDLVIEVLSETSRRTDELIKKKLYEQYGVAEYWIVAPLLESLKIYRKSATGGYAKAVEYEPQSTAPIETPLLPGLAIRLAQVFE